VEPPGHHHAPVRRAVESRDGVGTALLAALDRRARAGGARCLWLETQNINYPAIQFYRRSGFRLCGLDDTLYDPELDPTTGPDEVALFFTRPL
jgi:ribosomal protein S18 acetylase RimI-like enzyme